MFRKIAIILSFGFSASLIGTAALAGPITLTSGTSLATLQEVLDGPPTGFFTLYDGNFVSAAERFSGLNVSDPGGSEFESYSGTATAPLTLAPGEVNDGVFVNGFIAGLAGGTGGVEVGEGVIAFLFDFDILELGFSIIGSDPGGGGMTAFFYRNDGSFLDKITTDLSGDVTFTSTQAFRGLAIQNTDKEGLGYDNFRFDAASVPEPGTLALLVVGLAGIGFRRR